MLVSGNDKCLQQQWEGRKKDKIGCSEEAAVSPFNYDERRDLPNTAAIEMLRPKNPKSFLPGLAAKALRSKKRKEEEGSVARLGLKYQLRF